MNGKRFYILIALGLGVIGSAKSALVLDPTFRAEFEPNTFVSAFALRPSGEILAAVFKESAANVGAAKIVQFESNGSTDAKFECEIAFEGVGEILVQKDGKALVMGRRGDGTAGSLFRLMADGKLDEEFSAPELLGTLDIAVDALGRIYAAGNHHRAFWSGHVLARLHPDGRLDETFNAATLPEATRDGGLVRVTVQTDGKPVLAGVFQSPSGRDHLARFLEDGSEDSSFSNTNPVSPARCNRLLALPDGSILSGYGRWTNDGLSATVRRFMPDRTEDTAFGGLSGLEGTIDHFDLQKDGKIIASISSTRRDQRQLVRFDRNGRLDPSFGSAEARFKWIWLGVEYEGAGSPVVQPNGDIIVGGSFTSYNGVNCTNLVRFLGERAYVDSVELGAQALVVRWLLTEPHKDYAVEASDDLINWAVQEELKRNSDRLEASFSRSHTKMFFRAVLR
jgi:uncharacterized delta-60 repeat protein